MSLSNFLPADFGDVIDLLGFGAAAAGIYVAWQQSSKWIDEFRYRRDHDTAKQLNAAVNEWIGRVRWARRSLRREPAELVKDDPHAAHRRDLEWAAEAASAAATALSEAMVVWGYNDELLGAARLKMRQVGFDLAFAFEIITEPKSKPYASPVEIEHEKQARVTLFAKSYRIDKGEDEIESALIEIHDAIERATRSILGSRPGASGRPVKHPASR